MCGALVLPLWLKLPWTCQTEIADVEPCRVAGVAEVAVDLALVDVAVGVGAEEAVVAVNSPAEPVIARLPLMIDRVVHLVEGRRRSRSRSGRIVT